MMVSATSAIAGESVTCDTTMLPRLDIQTVVARVQTFARENQLESPRYKVVEVVYVRDRCYWLVTFGVSSQNISESGFGLIISDTSERISLQKSL